MRMKKTIGIGLTSVFALFIRVYQLLTKLIFIISAPFQILIATNKRISKSWSKINQKQQQVCEYIQVIANSSLSLMLAFGVLHYHQLFIQLILLVSHHVHHWFLRLIAEVPDLSTFLRNSYQMKLFLCHLYLIFGYAGLSAQISLTVDLIYLCNMPTIVLYKLLARIYKFLRKYFWLLIQLLTKSQAQWLSCPYHPWLLRDSYKIVYISCLPLFAVSMAIVGFYYLWLTFVIVALKIVMNIGLNISAIIDQIGYILCVIKGIKFNEKANAINLSKRQMIRARFQRLQWITIFELPMIFQIFEGNDLLSSCTNIQKIQKGKNYSQIYQKLKSLIR